MKAAVFKATGEPLAVEQVPDPTPQPDELLIEVAACGICGTDIHVSNLPGGLPPGAVMGHEFAGEIVEVGRQAHGDWCVGERIAVVPYLGCGSCHACLDGGDVMLCPSVRSAGFGEISGGYAELARVGSREAVRLGGNVSSEVGATVEPLCVALNAVEHADLSGGAKVLVLGAGPIGLAVAHWARFFGAGEVIVSDRVESRLALAADFGATQSIDLSREDPASVLARLPGGAPDVVFECVGLPGVIQQGIDWVRPRGQIIVVGVCMESDTFAPAQAIAKGLTLRFVIAYRVRHFQFAVEMLASERIRSAPMITDIVDFERFSQAFEELRRPTKQCKVVLSPHLSPAGDAE